MERSNYLSVCILTIFLRKSLLDITETQLNPRQLLIMAAGGKAIGGIVE